MWVLWIKRIFFLGEFRFKIFGSLERLEIAANNTQKNRRMG